MRTLNQEIETCPCAICRSDMAYIYPCESPLVIMTEMVIEEETPKAIKTAKEGSAKRNSSIEETGS